MDEPRNIISDIRIDSEGIWYSGKTVIQNSQILLFFKKNIFYDINGMFIFNQFGEKSEKAYIKVEGPVLKVTGITNDEFILDNGEKLDISNKELAMDKSGKLYIVVDKLKAWAVLTRQAIADLSGRLENKNDIYFWNKKQVRVINQIPWFFG
jgi:hypothetical protein